MSAMTPASAAYRWAPDVLEFARRRQVADYLDPLMTAICRHFPNAEGVRVFLEEDAEIRDEWSIVFEVRVGWPDLDAIHVARRRYKEDLFRICPAPLACVFVLTLELVSE
jgi:hypothetical protein